MKRGRSNAILKQFDAWAAYPLRWWRCRQSEFISDLLKESHGRTLTGKIDGVFLAQQAWEALVGRKIAQTGTKQYRAGETERKENYGIMITRWTKGAQTCFRPQAHR
jgi:hypothetical protein